MSGSMGGPCCVCGEYVWKNTFGRSHVCPPRWAVWPDHYDEDDAHSVYASDEQAAVERWADDYDSDGDYTIISGSVETVFVRPHGDHDAVPTKWHVCGEAVPKYHATQQEK